MSKNFKKHVTSLILIISCFISINVYAAEFKTTVAVPTTIESVGDSLENELKEYNSYVSARQLVISTAQATAEAKKTAKNELTSAKTAHDEFIKSCFKVCGIEGFELDPISTTATNGEIENAVLEAEIKYNEYLDMLEDKSANTDNMDDVIAAAQNSAQKKYSEFEQTAEDIKADQSRLPNSQEEAMEYAKREESAAEKRLKILTNATGDVTEYGDPDALINGTLGGLQELILKYAKTIGAIILFASILMVGFSIILNRNKAEERTASMTALLYIGIGSFMLSIVILIVDFLTSLMNTAS